MAESNQKQYRRILEADVIYKYRMGITGLVMIGNNLYRR